MLKNYEEPIVAAINELVLICRPLFKGNEDQREIWSQVAYLKGMIDAIDAQIERCGPSNIG
jgi:hypothetical protein